MPFTSPEREADSNDSEPNSMQESAREGADGTSFGRGVPSSPSQSTTVSVSTDNSTRFLTASELRDVEADPYLSARDVWGGST